MAMLYNLAAATYNTKADTILMSQAFLIANCSYIKGRIWKNWKRENKIVSNVNCDDALGENLLSPYV
jgi:hypothetical protein